ncbi:Hypp4130 [Branchiostoma lanceolatum]|uniref:Hypp4130 protein n=1 Tax=Branchiostoma lanceolatum TaxID=7740 RepID=A0A8K0EWQ2_BRALA|nr:Hypp4130 [Branchiostoma lanceolatum]
MDRPKRRSTSTSAGRDCDFDADGHSDEGESSSVVHRKPRTSYSLDAEVEAALVEWIRENQILWNSKLILFKRTDMKEALWTEKGEQLGKSAQYLKGWWRSIKDNFTRLDKKMHGDEPKDLTEREEWILNSCSFLFKMAASYGTWEAVTDEEQVEVPNGSQHLSSEQNMKARRRYPWRRDHEDVMAEFWLNNPIFYDKSLEHYKNKDRKSQLIQEFVQQNREDWGKIHNTMPTDQSRPCQAGGDTLAQRGDTLAQVAAQADMEEEDDETPSTSRPKTWTTTTTKKHKRDDNPTLHTHQDNLLQSSRLLKQTAEPANISRRVTFANFVRDSLLTMSKPKYKVAKAAIWDILHKLDMDDDSSCSDDDEHHTPSPLFITPSVNRPVGPGAAPPTCWEISASPHMNSFSPMNT